MAVLYDPNGNPIPAEVIAAMREEQASPVLGGVRSIYNQQPADGITPWRLAAIHKAAAVGDTLAYQELAEDIEERDPHYFAVLSTRKLTVTQLPLMVEAASEDAEHVKHKAFLEDWLSSGMLDDALFDILDGIGKGYSIHEIDWDVRPGAILPKALKFRLARWFTVDRQDGDTILLRDGAGYLPLAPFKFVVHKHPVKSGLLLRSGLARIASWSWMFKEFTLRDWAAFVQNYGTPIRLGRYGTESSKAERQVLWRAVSNLAGDCAAIIPKSMEVEFIDAPNVAGAAEVHHKRAEFLNQQISKIVLGQTATTDAAPGSHAIGSTHRKVQEDIERADAKRLSTTITRQLFALIISLNFGPQKAYPRAVIGRDDDVPLDEVIKALQFMGPQGLKVSAREMREQLGFSEPAEDEEVVGGRPVVPQAPTPTVTSPALPTSSEDPPTDFAQPGKPQEQQAPQTMMRRLLSLHSQALDPELVEMMGQRLARDARGALAGLTDQVRAVVEGATDMRDLVHRLETLELDPEQFSLAMQRGIAVAHLAGQAALLDEIGRG